MCSLFTGKCFTGCETFLGSSCSFHLNDAFLTVSHRSKNLVFPTVADSLVNDTRGVQVFIFQRKQTLNFSRFYVNSFCNQHIFTTIRYRTWWILLFKETFCNYNFCLLSIVNFFFFSIWLFCFIITDHTINESF